MKDTAQNRRVHLIYLIIISAFVFIVLFFAYLNTAAFNSYIETETEYLSMDYSETFTSVYSSIIEDASSPLPAIKAANITVYKNEIEDINVYIVDETGKVISKDSTGDIKNIFELSMFSEIKDTLLSGTNNDTTAFWTGYHDIFFCGQKYCVVKKLCVDGYYLITVNNALSVMDLQRKQYSLMIFIALVLMVFILLLISNIITNYRKQIVKLATTDELTGLSNRKYFTKEFEHFISDNADKESCIFLLDIDYFKQINDNYGHITGDEALKLLSNHLNEIVTKDIGFVGRWGGDEFIGVLNCPAEECKKILENLCNNISEDTVSSKISMTISVGYVKISSKDSLYSHYEKADKALYNSKSLGKNTVTMYSDDICSSSKASEEKASSAIKANTISLTKETGNDFFNKTNFKTKLIESILFAVKSMTPFIAGGGMLIALAFLLDAASIDLTALTLEQKSQLGSITSAAAMLKDLGDISFNLMLPVFAAFMACGLAGTEAFLSGFIGGYLISDTNSGFIGAIIAGIVAGLLTRQLKQFSVRLPKFLQQITPIIFYPMLSLLIMKALSVFIIGPVSSGISYIFTNLLDYVSQYGKIPVSALSSAMMAIDMGGVINKSAYTYGLASITEGESVIMAAVMAGGMVPPIGIAISALFFKNKYDKDEKSNAVTTLFMGLSFITEGALPYVIKDIVRVITASVFGSMFSGILVSEFKCSVPAPHGGIFILPLIGNPFAFFFSVFAGAALTAVILGILKKNKKQPD
ncbi:MAG: fructose-specific PTS transporter subunit EIIC [Eubacterium sp.]|nr:fructose-specific PTS transporter subunit EIIC [Eubacterium sp.]